MPAYHAPLRDHRFVLNDLLNVQQYNNLPGFAEATNDIVDAILESAHELWSVARLQVTCGSGVMDTATVVLRDSNFDARVNALKGATLWIQREAGAKGFMPPHDLCECKPHGSGVDSVTHRDPAIHVRPAPCTVVHVVGPEAPLHH